MSFNLMDNAVYHWAKDRKIFEQSDPKAQMKKLREELEELNNAIGTNYLPDIIDSIGDMMVVLSIISRMYDLNLEQCYITAYHHIKNRKGKMVNGLFVKEKE